MKAQKSDATFQRIVALRLNLDDAVEAGQPTADIRHAIKMLESQIFEERAAEYRAAASAATEKAKKAQRRADELAAAAAHAISTTANQFSLKD